METLFTDSETKTFEAIWILLRVGNKYGASRLLGDDEYISYKIWEDINWADMYKKHLPDAKVCRGKNPHIIFHGGCLRCKSQRIYGIERCKGCCFFKGNWDSKNLFIDGEQGAKISAEDLKKFLNDDEE